jgi:hypothetical protein
MRKVVRKVHRFYYKMVVAIILLSLEAKDDDI